MNKNQGFTLIELLVVVLIIGILSSVALPQYQTAVEKSRAANAIVAGKAIKNAEEIYYLANGAYTNQMENLDIEISAVKGFELGLMENNQNKVMLKRNDSAGNLMYAILFSFGSRKSGETDVSNTSYCAAPPAHTLGNRVCGSYGPMFWGDSGWNRYQLN